MEKPEYTIVEVFSDNGMHSHWSLVESETGVKVWSSDPVECKAMGYPVKDSEEIESIRIKASRYDALGEKISKFYTDTNGEFSEMNPQSAGDLDDIGEIAAAEFGWL